MTIDRFALIVGAAKCGTSSLFQYLAQHPLVAPSQPKEPNFFASDENWSKGREWYESLFDYDPARHAWVLDGSTFYSKHPDCANAPVRMLEFGGTYRIIYVVRNPIERVESHIRHNLMFGLASIDTPLHELVKQTMIDQSSYFMQWSRYAKHFHADHRLLLDFDEIRLHPENVMIQICRFLGIDDGYIFKGLGLVHNKSKVDGPTYKLIEKLPISKNIRNMIPLRFREGVRNRLSRRLPIDDVYPTHIRTKVRAYIREQIRFDANCFREEFGFDTSKWELDGESALSGEVA